MILNTSDDELMSTYFQCVRSKGGTKGTPLNSCVQLASYLAARTQGKGKLRFMPGNMWRF